MQCLLFVLLLCCCILLLLVLLYSVMSSSTLERLLLCVFQQYVLLVSCLASWSCESIIIPDYHKSYHPWCPICISHPGHNKDGQPIYSNWLNARCNEQLMTLFTFYTLMILSSHTTMAQENSLFKSFTTFPKISGQWVDFILVYNVLYHIWVVRTPFSTYSTFSTYRTYSTIDDQVENNDKYHILHSFNMFPNVNQELNLNAFNVKISDMGLKRCQWQISLRSRGLSWAAGIPGCQSRIRGKQWKCYSSSRLIFDPRENL